MSTIDTPERRLAVRQSAEISAAKHLARTYGVSMRRRRRVGPVIYDIGLVSGRESIGFGELTFTDEGRLEESHLFGEPRAGVSMLELESLLEFGPQPESETTLHLSEAPEPLTAPVPILRLDDEPAVVVVPLPPVVLPPPRALAAPTRRIVSVRVPLVSARVPSREIAAYGARDDSEARRLWGRFALGLALMLVAVSLAFLVITTPVPPQLWIATTVGLGLSALWGFGLLGSAIKANDERLEQLGAAA